MIFFAAIFSFLLGNAYAQDSMKKYDCFYGVCLNDKMRKDKYPKIDGNDYIRTIEVCSDKIVSINVRVTNVDINDGLSRLREFHSKNSDLGWEWLSEPKYIMGAGITFTYANKGIYGYRTYSHKLIRFQNKPNDLLDEASITSIHPEFNALCNPGGIAAMGSDSIQID
jgi:hypothetical protein